MYKSFMFINIFQKSILTLWRPNKTNNTPPQRRILEISDNITYFSEIFDEIIFPPSTAVLVHTKWPSKAPTRTTKVSSVAKAIVVI